MLHDPWTIVGWALVAILAVAILSVPVAVVMMIHIRRRSYEALEAHRQRVRDLRAPAAGRTR